MKFKQFKEILSNDFQNQKILTFLIPFKYIFIFFNLIFLMKFTNFYLFSIKTTNSSNEVAIEYATMFPLETQQVSEKEHYKLFNALVFVSNCFF